MPTLLIVDDHEPVLRTLEFVLGPCGYHILTAGSGKAALEMARAEIVDAALIDLLMPGMDGFATGEALASYSRESGRPFAWWMMSAAFSGEAQKRALATGAVALLSKPFACEELMTCLLARLGTSNGPAASNGNLPPETPLTMR